MRPEVTAPPFDVDAVRRRFAALQRPIAFFDGPGGSQVPDEVIDAMVGYLRGANANLGGPFVTSRESDLVVERAHARAAAFLGCDADEIVFGANMTTLNFALSRTLARGLRGGDEVLVTRLDHDANVSPWLELAHDAGLVVRFADFDPASGRLDLDDLAGKLSPRTRVVAFPWASNAIGTISDARRIAELAHEAGALAWADAVHYAPHAPIDVRAAGVDVLLCSPYKFFGPHLGIAYIRRDVAVRWRPYKVRPAATEPLGHRFETGTLSHEALAGLAAAVDYVESVGWAGIQAHERALGERFLAGLASPWRLHGPPTMEDRTPTFAVTHPGRTPDEIAAHLADRDIAVWPGHYYAIEVMRRLGLARGAVRVGLLHYNTEAEVDRLSGALRALA